MARSWAAAAVASEMVPQIEVRKAVSIEDLDAAALVRCAVFADELAYLDPGRFPAGREVDGFDLLATTVNFLGLVDGQPVATVRLLCPNADVAARCGTEHGLSMERYLELRGIGADIVPAEIPRSSVLARHRRTGVMRHLYFAAFEECNRRGLTHWLAVANTETDSDTDAGIVQQLLAARHYLVPHLGASCREAGRPSAVARYPLFTASERERARDGEVNGLRIPRTLELFASKLGVRYFGEPFFDSDFRMFALPLIVSMTDFARSPYGQPH